MKDTIYREDAIKHIKKRLYETAMNNIHSSGKPSDAYADVAEYRLDIWVSELPSAEGTGWTPCSEGLPKKYGEYLCCDIRGEYILGMPFGDEDSDTGFAVETGSEYMINCIAWMPLPKPYKA